MEPSTELFIQLLNFWFDKEAPRTEEPSEGMKRFANDIIYGVKHGDDRIFSHPQINKIILLLKDAGIVEYDKTILELYFIGRMRVQIELREIFNDPVITESLTALMNVMGEMAKKFEKEAKKQLEDEKNFSAIPELSQKHIFEN
jgi:hypothetical protein